MSQRREPLSALSKTREPSVQRRVRGKKGICKTNLNSPIAKVKMKKIGVKTGM